CMTKPINCIVKDCPNPAHAKGYCRRHYGQIWRHGIIYTDIPKKKNSVPESEMRRDDRLKSLERELRKAQQIYEVVVGFQGRIKWHREMEAVQNEIYKLTEIGDGTPPSEPSSSDSGAMAAIKSDNFHESTL
ncbi:MAG: hypothetical protein V1899_12980, partial [Planctomycetota bacterium]